MKRSIAIVILLLLTMCLFAEGEEISDSPLEFGGSVGTVIIGDQTYMRFRLNPELTIGKLGIGLDVDLLIEEDGDIREEDWNDWKDYINKLYYVRWSQRGDTFFAKLGSFDSYSLGRGLVFDDYTNTLNYPSERQLGLMLGGRLPVMEMELESFTSNITVPSIWAGRMSLAPLYLSKIPILEKLRIGVTAGYDADQYKGISKDEEEIIKNTLDSDNDGIPDVDDFDPDNDNKYTKNALIEMGFTDEQIKVFEDSLWIDKDENLDDPLGDLDEDDLAVLGFDYYLPLVESDVLSLGHYAELAQIIDYGYGFTFPGFYAKFLIFHLNLEYRQYAEDFLPGYFNHFYDQERAYLQLNLEEDQYEIFIKESRLEEIPSQRGWYGKLRADLFDFLYMEASYTDMYADGDDDGLKSLVGTVGINTKIVPKLKNMEFKYYQLDVAKISKFIAPQVVIIGTLRYELGAKTYLLWQYQERYVDIDGNNEIKGDDETIRDVSLGVEFKF